MSQGYDIYAKATGIANVKLPNNKAESSPTEKSVEAKLHVQLFMEGTINQKREDPSSTKESSRIPVRKLSIRYGNDSRYWEFKKLNDKDIGLIGFKEAALLLQVNWFEVTGKIELKATNPKTYNIFYIIKFQVDAFGWHSAPTKSKVKVAGEKEINQSLPLEPYRKKPNEWHEVPGGKFTVPGNTVRSVEFGMSDVESEWWKGGMVLAGVVIKS